MFAKTILDNINGNKIFLKQSLNGKYRVIHMHGGRCYLKNS